jgi:Vacuolar protein sorting-associated protein 26
MPLHVSARHCTHSSRGRTQRGGGQHKRLAESICEGNCAGIPSCVVLCAARDLSPPGELTSQQLLPFEFNSVEMEHDSYRGLQVRLRWGFGVSNLCMST